MSKLQVPRIPHAKAVVAAGVSAAVIGSGAMAYAAIGPTPPAPTAALTASLTSAGVTAAAGTPANRAALRATARSGAGPAGSAGTSARTSRAPAMRQLRNLAIGEASFSPSGGAASVGTITIRTANGQTVTANLAKRTRVFAYQGPRVKPTAETISKLEANRGELVAVRVVSRKAPASTSSASASTTGTLYAALIVDLGFANSGS